jgi:membrane-associated protease RseP (regulator of RpoE activity)
MNLHALFATGHGPLGFGEMALLAVLGSWIALVVHELGHALAAWIVGVRMWGITVGIGPTVWAGTVRGCRIRLALLPILGSIQLLDDDANAIGYRDLTRGSWRFVWVRGAWRAPVISAAGGVANLAMAAALIYLLSFIGAFAPGLQFLAFCTAIANLSGYLNLLPCFSSDGRHLAAHIRAVRESHAAALAAQGAS